jgi:hypothetical protein
VRLALRPELWAAVSDGAITLVVALMEVRTIARRARPTFVWWRVGETRVGGVARDRTTTLSSPLARLES